MTNADRVRRRKSPLGIILSLSAVLLGIGLAAVALYNINAQSRGSITAYQAPTSTLSTISVEPFAVLSDAAIPSPYPARGELIGSLKIPLLKLTLPIVEGTGSDELKQGVGHFIDSVFPGEQDNCVLSGHRDTVFTELGTLEIGDRVIAETSTGVYTYEIKNIRIVDKDDKTVIVPSDHAVLTLSTCYPFRYVGSAPDRYILTADLISSQSR